MSESYAFSSSPQPIKPFSFLIFLSVLLSAIHFSLSLPSKTHFGSNLVLIGDAKFANNSSCIRLTNPTISSPSSGFLIQKKPIKLFSSNSKSRKPVSFSTDFSFSISPHNGDGLAFLVVPKNFISKFSTENFGVLKENRFLGVEFDTSADENVGDVNANHVGVDVGSLVSVKTSNVSSINLVLNSGLKLHSWVDYDSSSKRIEIRLGKFGSARPYNPLLVYQVDLGEMWRNEEVLVGLSSSSGKSMQISNVYSWNFRTRTVPKWLHSQPLNPRAFSSKHSEEKLAQKKKICALGFLSGLVFMTGCGALLALVVLFLWALFENSSETVLTIPGNCTVHSDSWLQVGFVLTTGINSAYVLGYSGAIMVPLGWIGGVVGLILATAISLYANALVAKLHEYGGRRHIRYRDLAGFIYGIAAPPRDYGIYGTKLSRIFTTTSALANLVFSLNTGMLPEIQA
ncbi:hypothetical protein DH2020_010412 [Rehmannia glutinosa]|uniref:Non-specific serine/threonine protein kinase n=1 Tax=Rehmannia glutinosa TaxID=99300 RepID=A0ABR0XAL6_REHGL